MFCSICQTFQTQRLTTADVSFQFVSGWERQDQTYFAGTSAVIRVSGASGCEELGGRARLFVTFWDEHQSRVFWLEYIITSLVPDRTFSYFFIWVLCPRDSIESISLILSVLLSHRWITSGCNDNLTLLMDGTEIGYSRPPLWFHCWSKLIESRITEPPMSLWVLIFC